jgi:bifunctional DNA-binding transcriptional regulator/antitoxin component of YhaV-PrlF toxin-antitoxin module
MSMRLNVAGVAKIRECGDVRLPEAVLAELGWKQGDTLFVEVLEGGRVVVSKDSKAIAAYFSGALTHLFPEPGDIQRFLDEEHEAWGDFDDRRFED